jgi:hypothetical protein
MSLLDTASLIVTPNGYKEGKLYSVIPSDGSGDMSVTRATTATRVNSAGLVELVPYNLLQYSNTFGNAYWTKYQSSVTGGQSGYDGSTNAFLLADNGANDVHILQPNFTTSGQHTISIYAKANSLNWIWLRGVQSSANVRAWFNLSTGTIGTVETNGTANIESVGNGWYRCSLTIANHQSGFEFYYGVANANATTNYVGSGQSIFVQDAQLVEGSTAKDYQKTETRLNIPRLDYSNGTCPSLLVEPQRTNLLTYSSSFDNGAWTKSNTTATANTIISPSGIQDADSVAETTATNSHELSSNAITFSASTKYTATLYAKWDSACTRNIHIRFGNCPSVNIGASFDKNGNFVNYTGGSNGTLDSYSATDVGNGWWKFVITITTAAVSSSGQGLYVYYMDGTTLFYTGNTSQVINFWGAQLEAGSYATSYIPTTSASVTRNADVISKTGISSLIGQTEGTLFLDFYYDGTTNNHMIINDPSFNSYIYFNSQNANQLWAQIQNINIQFSALASAGRHKLALAYKSGSSAFYLDGVQVGTSATTFTLSGSMSILDFTLTTPNNAINAAALWKQRLTNTQLAQLTTI